MSWSNQLTELWTEGSVPKLQAYAGRLEAEIEHNPKPSKATRLLELQNSAITMVAAIQREDIKTVREDEAHSPIITFFGGLNARRR